MILWYNPSNLWMLKYHCRKLISFLALAFLQCTILLLSPHTKSMNLDTMPCAMCHLALSRLKEPRLGWPDPHRPQELRRWGSSIQILSSAPSNTFAKLCVCCFVTVCYTFVCTLFVSFLGGEPQHIHDSRLSTITGFVKFVV